MSRPPKDERPETGLNDEQVRNRVKPVRVHETDRDEVYQTQQAQRDREDFPWEPR